MSFSYVHDAFPRHALAGVWEFSTGWFGVGLWCVTMMVVSFGDEGVGMCRMVGVRRLVGLLVLGVSVAGCGGGPEVVESPSPVQQTSPGWMPTDPTDVELYLEADRVYRRLFEIIGPVEQSGDYSTLPPELEELVVGEYLDVVKRYFQTCEDKGYYVVGGYGEGDIITWPYRGGEYPDVDYVLEACRDSQEIITYQTGGVLVGPGPLRHDVYRFEQRGRVLVIVGGKSERVEACPK